MIEMKNKKKTSHKLGKRHKAKALMSRNLKSQGLPINIIIIAAIGLVVLVVVLAIFSGRMGILSKSIAGTCDEQGGKCACTLKDNKCNDDYPFRVIAKGCGKGGGEEGPCCLPSPIE